MSKREGTFTKGELVKKFTSDELEMNYYAKEESEELGVTVEEFAKQIAEEEFSIRLQEGTVVKVGRRYKVL